MKLYKVFMMKLHKTCFVFVSASGGVFQPLVAPASVVASTTSSTTVILSTVCAALGSMMLCAIILLAVRHYRRSSVESKMEKAVHASNGKSIYDHGTFGFSVGSKFARQAADDDTISTSTSATTDNFSTMSY